jgi:hypothetical protein
MIFPAEARINLSWRRLVLTNLNKRSPNCQQTNVLVIKHITKTKFVPLCMIFIITTFVIITKVIYKGINLSYYCISPFAKYGHSCKNRNLHFLKQYTFVYICTCRPAPPNLPFFPFPPLVLRLPRKTSKYREFDHSTAVSAFISPPESKYLLSQVKRGRGCILSTRTFNRGAEHK